MRCEEFFERLSRMFPTVDTELEYEDPFPMLIGVVLSARCTDAAVSKCLPKLFANGDTPQDLLKLGQEEVAKRISSITYYNNKSKYIIGICHEIIKRNNIVPRTLEELETLPGVGRKTANIMLLFAFDQIAFPVDTHVFRVCNCTGLAPGKAPREVEEKLKVRVPKRYAQSSHRLLILYGRHVCKARPKCDGCVKITDFE